MMGWAYLAGILTLPLIVLIYIAWGCIVTGAGGAEVRFSITFN